MKNFRHIGLILLLPVLLLSFSTRIPDSTDFKRPYLTPYNSQISGRAASLAFDNDSEKFEKDQILVRFKPSVHFKKQEAILAMYRTSGIKYIPQIHLHQVKIAEDMTVEEMTFLLNLNPFVEYAEPNQIVHIAVTPNDTFFHLQYALSNTGQMLGTIPGSPQGKESADIKATLAWEETTGSEEVVIGFIDTGMDFYHPELQNKYFSKGRDFVNNDYDATDDEGHGTAVASIMAAETNNSAGIAGVAWKCKVLPAKAIDKNGLGETIWVIEAIIWLADQGVDVINFSIGQKLPSQSLENALAYAYSKEIVLIAAAGNESSAVLYPAAYDDYVLAVAATDYYDEWVNSSNMGPEIDVAAPGVRIFACVPLWFPPLIWDDYTLGPYRHVEGTSASCAHVAGLAALIRSIKPHLTASDIMNIIRYSADDVNKGLFPGKDQYIGYGRIDAAVALVPLLLNPEKK